MDAEVIIPIVSVVVGGLIVLVPVAGLTLRFALKPMIDSWVHARGLFASEEQLRRLEDRLTAVETELRLLSAPRNAHLGSGRDD